MNNPIQPFNKIKRKRNQRILHLPALFVSTDDGIHLLNRRRICVKVDSERSLFAPHKLMQRENLLTQRATDQTRIFQNLIIRNPNPLNPYVEYPDLQTVSKGKIDSLITSLPPEKSSSLSPSQSSSFKTSALFPSNFGKIR